MRKRLLMIGAAFVVALSMATALGAQRQGGPAGPGRQGRQGQPPMAAGQQPPAAQPNGGPDREPPFARQLGLTDEQQSKLETIMRTTRDAEAPLADELEFVRKSLHRETFADARNASRISTLSAKVVDLEKQLLDLRVKSQISLSDLLTADQRIKVRVNGGIGAGNAGRGRPGGPNGSQGPAGPGGGSPGRIGAGGQMGPMGADNPGPGRGRGGPDGPAN